MERQTVIQRIWDEFEAPLRTHGYELVEVEFGPQYGRQVLRVYIDKQNGGISLDDCTAVSQLLTPVLDRSDFVPKRCVLEVSSPGLDRPLRKAADFERFVGEPVRLQTHVPVNARKNFTGVLRGLADGLIALECDGVVYEIHLENLKKAHLNR